MRGFYIAAMLLIYTAANSQSFTGKVIDESTNEPLPFVTVAAGKPILLTSVTDMQGKFELQTNEKIDSIHFSLLGYKPKTVSTGTRVIKMSPVRAELNQVIVTAGRDEQVRSETPIAITSISKNTLNETKANSLEMVLNKVSGVYMVDLGNEQHSMAIRQPISTRSLFLYMEDGVPIRTTGDFNHNALIEINSAALKTIEVVRGPASSLYGSEAIGGAVNFITQAPSAINTLKLQTEMSTLGCSRSEFNISGTKNKFGVFAGGYYTNQNHRYRDHNDFTKAAVTLRGDLLISERTKLVTSTSYVDYKTDQTGGLDSTHFYSKDYISFHTFTYRKVTALRVRSTLEHSFNDRSALMITGYYRKNEVGQNPFYAIKTTKNPLVSRGEINNDAFRSYGTILQHRYKFSFMDARIISGISFDYSPATYHANFILISKNKEGYFTGYEATDSVLTDYKANLINSAAYAQAEITPVNRLRLVAAVRYDKLTYQFDNKLPPSAFTGSPDNTDHFSRFTPKVGLTYRLFKNVSTYANYSVGFAPPQITELYRGVKVPVLVPASFQNYEAGIWFNFHKDRGYADISIYQLEGRNEIVSVRLPDGSYENQNTGRTVHKGIEYSVRYAVIEALQIRVSASNAEHRYLEYIERGKDYAGNFMSTAPPFILNSEVTYRPSFIRNFRISAEVQHVSPYFMDQANTEKYEGYTMINLRTGYKIRSLEFWINAINITDEVYATVAEKSAFGKNYRPGNLRTIFAGIGYNISGTR